VRAYQALEVESIAWACYRPLAHCFDLDVVDSTDLVRHVVVRLACVGQGRFVEVRIDLEDLDQAVLEESHVLVVDTNLVEEGRRKACHSQAQRQELLESHVVHLEARNVTVAAVAVAVVVEVGNRRTVSMVAAVEEEDREIVDFGAEVVVEDALTEHWLATVQSSFHQCDQVVKVPQKEGNGNFHTVLRSRWFLYCLHPKMFNHREREMTGLVI